jgi:glycine hydroxymethyltransferase
VPHADLVSTTVHKTLGGARSGLILGKQEYAKAVNSSVFPGTQGGPAMQVVAAKAVTFKIAATAEFAERQLRTLSGARIIAERLLAADATRAGVSVVSGGTDVHLVLVDLRDSPLDGKAAEDLLHDIGITVNRNAVPNDPRPPMVTSGLRIGTPALATRGFGDTEFTEVADIIAMALTQGSSTDVAGPSRPRQAVGQRVSAVRRARGLGAAGPPVTRRTQFQKTCELGLQLLLWHRNL